MSPFAVVTGSFDPVTVGHVDLVRRAASIFGRCVLLVVNNREKNYLFTPEERVAFCRAAAASLPGVEVDYYEGMLYEWLLAHPGCVIVKGVRNGEDLAYERTQSTFNYAHSGVETLYLDAREELKEISSSLVRARLAEKGDWERLVPKEIVTILRGKL